MVAAPADAASTQPGVPPCVACGVAVADLYACLHCVTFACRRRRHIQHHLDAAGHALGSSLATARGRGRASLMGSVL